MRILLKISIYLLLLLLILGILDFFVADDSFFQDYIRGTFTETIGIIITLILIEFILGQNRIKENQDKAKKNLIRAKNVINIYLENYNDVAFNLAYKYNQYENQRKIGLEKNFPFTNLSELFLKSPSLFDDFNSTKVSSYFERLDDLKKIIRTTLFQTDLTDFPEISELLESYLTEVEKYYPRDGILSDKNTKVGDTKTPDFVKEMIEKQTGKLEYLHSNMINKYIRLYELINYHIEFNEKYNNLLEKNIN